VLKDKQDQTDKSRMMNKNRRDNNRGTRMEERTTTDEEGMGE
jgi:hypothetical protein